MNKPMFTIYRADCIGNAANCVYPNKFEINSADDLKQAVDRDYVCAEYKDNYRSTDNFIKSNCLAMDCDNDHSDNPDDWVTPKTVEDTFKGVSFAVHFSRHNNMRKGNKSARPRFHVLFSIDEVSSSEEYRRIKEQTLLMFPCFDSAAKDSARFFFGTPDAEVEIHEGVLTLTEFIKMLKDSVDEDEQTLQDFINYDSEHSRKRTEVIVQGNRNREMSLFAGKILKKYGDNEETYKLFLERAESCEPPLDSGELAKIWASARKFYERVKNQPGYIEPEEYEKQCQDEHRCFEDCSNETPRQNKVINWETPIPFKKVNVPPFPIETLPEAIRNYCVAIAESTQTPVDMAATCSIAIMSVCLQGKYKVQGKPGWMEPLNTFVLNIMEPSERKSAVANAMMRPINEYEKNMNKLGGPAIERNKIQKELLENKKKALFQKASKGKVSDREIDEISQELADFKELKPLKLYVDDVTTEKLTSVLAANNGVAAIMSTEGGIFDMLNGGYSKIIKIDSILKGYSGDPIKVGRVGRPDECIMDPALTVLLMAQPSVLAGLMESRTFRGRGLTARFLYCMPNSMVGKRKYNTEAVRDAVYQSYASLIKNMLEDERNEKPKIIELSPEASLQLEKLHYKLEPKIPKEYEDIKEWVGKLLGNVLRISALLARANRFIDHDFILDDDIEEQIMVSGVDMSGAIKIGEFFLEHAFAAFSLMGADPDMKMCERIVKTIRRLDLREFTIRDISRKCKFIGKTEDAEMYVNKLKQLGYVSEKENTFYPGKGRPKSVTFEVNPVVFSSNEYI